MAKVTLESLVAQNRVEDALIQLGQLLENLYQRYPNQVTLLQSRIVDNRNRLANGLITEAQSKTEENQIKASLLDLLGVIRSDLRDQFTLLQSASTRTEDRSNLQDYVVSRTRGRYTIKGMLKEGSSLVTFRANDNSTGRDVIIKVLKVDYFKGDIGARLTESFRAEVARVRLLKHRNIIKLQDVFFDESPFFVVAEYVWGVNISELLDSIGSIPFFLTLEILIELCDVLDYLRYRQIFHTNIRPSKIMLDEESKPMISPFEVIKAGSTERKMSKFCEDCRYLSPEMLEDGANLEVEPDTLLEAEKNDQFCIGLVAYEMLTGEPLFLGKTIPEVILNRRRFFADADLREAKLKKLSDTGCPPEFVAIVRQLLCKNPDERFNSVWQLGDQLRQFRPKLNSRQYVLLESYNRCLAMHPDFIELFYQRFFQAIPGVEQRFPKENWERQVKMLQAAQRAFLESGEDPSFMFRLPNIRGHAGVTFDQYKLFIETFLQTIAACDPRWELPEVSGAWQQTVDMMLPQLKKLIES